MILWIIIWIITFLILVLIHEFWHFIAAKKSGVKVLEFWIGIPPRLFTFWRDKDWTEYTFNLLPFGGFVRLKWESPDNPQEFLAKDSFITQPLYKKLVILFGWVFMNFLLAVFLFWIVFMIGVKSFGIFPFWHSESLVVPSLDYALDKGIITGSKENFYPKVAYVVSGYDAFKKGILSWDIILKINGQEVNFISLKKVLQNNCWKYVNLVIKRWDKILNKRVFVDPKKDCKIWILPVPAGSIKFKEIKLPPSQALWAAFKETWEEAKITFIMLSNLIEKLLTFNKEKVKEAVSQFSGPVGAVKIWEIILEQFGWVQYLLFAAMISLALAIFNILPIPALDGWRAVSVIIQSVLRLEPIKYFTIENRLNIVFFVLLMSLGVYIMWLDLQRFWGL